jgi:hypothetical protein
MTLLTSLRDPGLHVIGVVCRLEILQVTIDAGGIRAVQAVVVVHVALEALR